MAHIVSTTQPPLSSALGDEWYEPTSGKFYKLVAAGGTTVIWQDFTPFYTANLVAGQYMTIAANGQINANITAGTGITINNGQITASGARTVGYNLVFGT